MTHPWKWAVVVAFGLAACERSSVTRAEIDATALRSAATRAGGVEVGTSTVQVHVQGDGFNALDAVVDPNTLQATLDVPSGPDRVFEVIARIGKDASSVRYYGRVRRDMPSGATVLVVLPAFPAGLVRGTAATVEGVPLPDATKLRLQAVAPRPDAPSSLDAQVQNGGFAQPLPAGAHQVTASVQVGGQTYTTQQDFVVRAGQVTELAVVLRSLATPHLVFSAQPAASVAADGGVSAEVTLLDRQGALVTDQPLAVTFAAVNIDTGVAVPLTGTTEGALVAGKRAANALAVRLAGGPYALEATAPGLQTARSTAFTVLPGPLQGTGVVAPAQVVAGVPFAARVGGVDAYNNLVPTFTGTVQLSTSDPAATSANIPASVEVVAGDAGGHAVTLTLMTAGGQFLQTSAQLLAGRNPIAVVAAQPARLAFAPLADSNVQACVPPAVQVKLLDAYGNFASHGAAEVTLGLQANPGRAPLRGTLTVTAVAGVARFADVAVSAPAAGYVLRASSPGLLAANSASLNASAPTPTLRLLGNNRVTASGPVSVAYVAQQACGESTDVALSFDTANGEVPASPLGNGAAGVLEQPAAPRTLAWDMPRDLGSNANMTTTLHLRPRSQGVTGAAVDVQVNAQTQVNAQSLDGTSSAVANVGGAALVAMAVADIDGNGLPDVAGVTGNGNTAVVVLQTSPGVYAAQTPVALSSAATRIRLADVDRDGDIDAVVALSLAGKVQVLTNGGSGGLQAMLPAVGFGAVRDLALADLNKDGLPDVAVTSDANTVSTSTNANFASPLTLSTVAVCTRGVALADVTRDGRIDAVVADCNRRVLVGENTGTSFVFTPYATDANVDAVAVADLNRDGLSEVVAAHGSAALLTVFPGLSGPPSLMAGGNLGPRATYPLPKPALDVAVTDVNGDGVPDLLALLQDGSLAALSGDGSGSLGSAVVLAPRGVSAFAVADLNRDGAPDVAVATATGVATALNQQPPSRRLPPHAPRGVNLPEAPIDVAVGNLDADGNPDLVVCMGTQTQAYLGRGDGLFTPGPAFSEMAQSLVLADLNHDHLGDLVLAEAGANTVSTALSRGDGSFAPAVPTALGAPVRQVLAGDFDEDGNADVVAFSANNVAVLFGDGSGDLSALASITLGNPTLGEARVADVNGDGHQDLVALNPGNGNVLIATGFGDGTFAAPREVAAVTGASALRVADLEGDGRADLVVQGGADTFVVLRGTGNGAFAVPAGLPVGLQQFGQALALGDYNGDGVPDAFMGTAGNLLMAHAGDGLGSFAAADVSISVSAPTGLRAADLDGDGTSDLVAFSHNTNALVAHISSRGGGFFAAQGTPLLGNTPHHPQLLDLNRDGKLDVVVPCTASNLATLAPGMGGGALGTPTTLALNAPSLIVSADFNRDGIGDIATVANNGNTVQIAPGNGLGGFGPTTNALAVANLDALAVADFNRDGAPDMLATSHGSNKLVLLANAGGSSFVTSYVVLPAAPRELAVGDFNRDSKVDVAVTQDTNALRVLSGDGATGMTTPGTVVTLPAPAQNVAVGDFDRDGRDDLVVTLPTTHQVLFLRNAGAGQFTTTAKRTVPPTPMHLSVGDVDGDGATDVVVSIAGGAVHVLLGDGVGGVKAEAQLITRSDVAGTALGDMNRDGRLDIVAVSNAGDTVELILSGYP